MKALGITAMIVAIVAIFVPILGPYVTILAAMMAAFAGGPGVTFGLVALILNVINIVALSPSLWIAAGGHEILAPGTENAAIWTGKFLIGVQIVAGIVLAAVHSSTKKNATHAATDGQTAGARNAAHENSRLGPILFVVVLLMVLVYSLFSGTDTKPRTTSTEATTSYATESEPEPDVAVEQRTSKWRVESEKDAMDDTQNIYLRLDAEEPVRLWPPTPTLVIRCVKNETDVAVVTGEPAGVIGDNSTRVRLRLDGRKPIASQWIPSTNFMALYAPNPIELAKSLALTKEFVFEYQSSMSGAVVARFSTDGLEEELTSVSRECHWK